MATISEMHDVLMRATYPSTKEMLIAEVKMMGVTEEEIIQRLQQLPDHYYGSVDTVIDTLRGIA